MTESMLSTNLGITGDQLTTKLYAVLAGIFWRKKVTKSFKSFFFELTS